MLHLKIAVRAQLMYSQTHVSTEPLEMLPLLWTDQTNWDTKDKMCRERPYFALV